MSTSLTAARSRSRTVHEQLAPVLPGLFPEAQYVTQESSTAPPSMRTHPRRPSTTVRRHARPACLKAKSSAGALAFAGPHQSAFRTEKGEDVRGAGVMGRQGHYGKAGAKVSKEASQEPKAGTVAGAVGKAASRNREPEPQLRPSGRGPHLTVNHRFQRTINS